MTKRIRYTNEPLGRLRIAEDFLPPPQELAFREEVEKVTISLSKRSLDFFRREAERAGTQYQPMIRKLLDAYASAHAGPLTKRSSGRGRDKVPSARAR
jgi:hypothetical protein